MFTLVASLPHARHGILKTEHGTVKTPFFMPVATAGAMKGITQRDLLELNAQILLCNTYHLHLQPGEDTVERAGGLHTFIGWEKPILTDSGGYQVFSFGKRGATNVTEEGVHFRSHLNGDAHFIGPKESMHIQHMLGADIIMVFDECPPSTAKRTSIEKAVDRTLRWAKECRKINDAYKQQTGKNPLLFGIVQGGLERDLREKCAQELQAIGFDGYAIGGLAVGENEEQMLSVVEAVAPLLPKDKPRYLMGVGDVEQIRACVERGIDMFDSVMPMRIARHGTILLSNRSQIRITNAQFKEDHSPIDPESPSHLSRQHTRSYLHHLLRANERLGETIAQMQNLGVTLQSMQQLRNAQ
ncbi:tRNA guanosine(34) transglycosylase Tgt [Candidatus Peregrinibacteria bacterium CG10_big_fil_rev_8_21_14_0_10_55_24]|nr:MAG: tRNA guanosine(34) transglycosylase Tgt [Candidatus Peregrinibacteria bacterium CG10_big_fil_rev_8_21_14_0_10_55_24]